MHRRLRVRLRAALRAAGRAYDAFCEPRRCAACHGVRGHSSRLCVVCARDLVPSHTACARCRDSTCGACSARIAPLASLSAAYDYRGTAGALVRRAKLDRDPAALGLLGDALCRSLHRRDARYRRAVVVPVPLARAKQRRRGFNQAEVLAERLARRLDVPASHVLRRVRDTATQGSQTSIAARQANVAGAFALRWPVCRRAAPHVLLVDDVATSGATLRECARVLRRSGCGRIDAIVVARA